MTRLLKKILFPLLALSVSLQAQPDLKILKSDQQTLILEWKLTDFIKKDVNSGSEVFQQIAFYESSNSFKEGFPDIPQKVITIGIPSGSGVQVQMLYNETETLADINLAPVFTPHKDKSGIDSYRITKNATVYKRNQLFPENVIAKSDPSQFRDIPIQRFFRLSILQYLKVTPLLIPYLVLN